MQTMIAAQIAHLAIVLASTAYFARRHAQAGPVFAHRLFAGRPEIAEAANRLVIVGMATLALGCGALLVTDLTSFGGWGRTIEKVSTRAGIYLLILAAFHLVRFNNLVTVYGEVLRTRAVNRATDTGAPARGAAAV